MTTSPPHEVNNDGVFHPESADELKKLIQSQQSVLVSESNNEEQQEFNKLSKDLKLSRLNNLIERSQIYSKIIADNILQTSLQNQQQIAEQQQQQPTPEQTPPKKKRRTTRANARAAKQDIVSMLSTNNISESTKTTRKAIEESQQHNSGNTKTLQPKLVTGCTLKDYQLDGLEWLVTLYQNGLNGILADEMGLGKTVQCISFLSFLIEKGITGPFLIVVPLSTLSNWYNEIKRFTPSIKVIKYAGTKLERAKINLASKSSQLNIVLTSYEISIKDFVKLSGINWSYLIVDEGHRLKNNECVLIKFLKKLNVSNRLLLTGTPLQNNLNELWSLLNFILPDIFHDLELFQQWFNFDELTSLGTDDDDEETKKLIKYNIQEALIKNLHTILKPFILRRLKKDVIKDLPPKREYLIQIPLTELQRKIYYDALNSKLFLSLIEVNLKEFIRYNHWDLFKSDLPRIDGFLSTAKGNSFKISKDKYDSNISYTEANTDDEFEESESDYNSSDISSDEIMTYEQALENLPRNKRAKQDLILQSLYHKIYKSTRHLSLQNLVMQLRNICNSPYVYYEPFLIDDSDNNKNDSKFMNALVSNSAKFQVLDQLVQPLISQGHKILIFSQFTKVLDLLQDWFTFQNTQVCRLDGTTSQIERESQISQFNNPSSKEVIFLLSTRAGGLGINLTGADSVILFDNDWNPQMDLQAIDRVHRIGQLKPVKIYRFVIKDSIEEILISKSTSKRFLEKLIIQMGEFKFNKLKKLIGGDDKDSELNVKELIELTKYNFKHTDDKNKGQQPSEFHFNFNTTKTYKPILTSEELSELLDRSPQCYSIDDSKFKNVTIFETVNNMDK
ncbi:putative ATP-dependent helicase IRC5 [Spathaspora sp. JA1]|nr:putative ATP-dependent helicase IRC5 [Spathaspora sp. JA1]